MFRLQPPRLTVSNGQPSGSKYSGKQVEQNCSLVGKLETRCSVENPVFLFPHWSKSGQRLAATLALNGQICCKRFFHLSLSIKFHIESITLHHITIHHFHHSLWSICKKGKQKWNIHSKSKLWKCWSSQQRWKYQQVMMAAAPPGLDQVWFKVFITILSPLKFFSSHNH